MHPQGLHLEARALTCYSLLRHCPFSFSRRVRPKDLKYWYSQLIISIKRLVWSSGVARNSQWEIGGLEAESPAAKGKEGQGAKAPVLGDFLQF